MNFEQRTKVVDYNHIPRMELYKQWCTGKKVLHIGCVDWPFHEENNLHIELQNWAEYADGYDIQLERYKLLDPYLKGESELWVDLPQNQNESWTYDVVLIPEVIEHVPDLPKFFDQMNNINTKQYIITVPCAIQCSQHSFGVQGDEVIEVVHPEHLCWYSPYTLKNTIETYTDWKIDFMFWNNGISVGVCCTKV